jgi:uncharacterized protein YcbK (DUF882 family)
MAPFMRKLLAVVLVSLATLWAVPGEAAPPKEHRVAKGQTLGKIAKRYGVGVEAICNANDITEKSKLKIGLKLLIPPKNDADGSATRKVLEQQRKGGAGAAGAKKPAPSPAAQPPSGGPASKAKGGEGVRWHAVTKGQRLGTIARRYKVTVEALRHANELGEKEMIRIGQQLIIPETDDVDGSRARAIWEERRGEPPAKHIDEAPAKEEKGPSWQKYVSKPAKPGYVKFNAIWGKSFEGYLLTKSGKVKKKVAEALKEVLSTSDGKEHDIDQRLVQLLTKVSDTFGGRTINVVSGYREGSTSRTSRHRHGKAIDFSVSGIPNTVLRDFVKTLDKVGVGYYPNSSFVHLDVREQWTYWIDYSGPGQRPRYGGFYTKH